MSAAQEIGKPEARITRALRVELIKPLAPHTWESAGRQLRGMRSVMHRLLNAAVLANLDADRKIISIAPQTAGYQAVRKAHAEFCEWARKHKDPSVQALAEITMGGGVVNALSSAANDAFKRWKKGKGNEQIPSFGKGQPVPVRAEQVTIAKDERGFTLECQLSEGRQGWIKFALAASTGRHYETLRNLVEGREGYKSLAIKIDWDDRRKKWYGLVSYSYPRPEPHAACDPDRVIVLHRGAHNFIYAMSSDGKATVVARGGGLMASKRKIAARRKSARMLKAGELGMGARGHGVARRYEGKDSLSDKEARITKTFCQQTAARVRTLIIQWGCGRVVIGDYGGIDPDEDRAIRRFVPRVPLYQLKSAIGNAIEPLSLIAEEVSESYVSRLCPRCNATNTEHSKFREMFKCFTCGFQNTADWVSALHMLRRAEPKENAINKRLENDYRLERIMRQRSQAENEAEESADSTAHTRGQVHSRTGPAREPDLLGTPQETHDPPPRSQPSGVARKATKKGTARKAVAKSTKRLGPGKVRRDD